MKLNSWIQPARAASRQSRFLRYSGGVWLILAPLSYGLGHWLEGYPEPFENIYASGLQKLLMQGISRTTGMLPLSLAEILVLIHLAAVPAVILIAAVKMIRGSAFRFLYRCSVYMAMAYVLFMALWGFNYSRQPLAATLGYTVRPYAVSELAALSALLVEEANTLRALQHVDERGIMTLQTDKATMLRRTREGYRKLSELYPIFEGTWGDPKPVILSEAMLYTGITGMFMPFTGEANLNMRVPELLLPAVALHEKAHQMGIAREDEANYAAYLASRYHPDPDFRYSGTVLALIHATNALYRENPELYFELRAHYSKGLSMDLDNYSTFWKAYEGKVNETADRVNDTYLKTNRQQDGVKSYGRMVDLLLAEVLTHGRVAAVPAN